MAKVILDPLVKSISGKTGGLVFYSSRNIQYVRRYVVPSNPNTPAQRSRRKSFAEAIAEWQVLSIEQKTRWNRKALGKMMSGYNLFISSFIKGKYASESNQEKISYIVFSDIIRSHSVYDKELLRDMTNYCSNSIYLSHNSNIEIKLNKNVLKIE